MKAYESRELANKVNSEKHKEQLNKILSLIEKNAGDGKLNYQYCEWLLTSVKSELQGLGYKITESSHRNESYTNISWENA